MNMILVQAFLGLFFLIIGASEMLNASPIAKGSLFKFLAGVLLLLLAILKVSLLAL